MTTENDIDIAVAAILSNTLPPRYDSRRKRWREGKMGLASKIRLLQEFGYRIEIRVTPPER